MPKLNKYVVSFYDYEERNDYELEYIGGGTPPTSSEFKKMISDKCSDILKQENEFILNVFYLSVISDGTEFQKYYDIRDQLKDYTLDIARKYNRFASEKEIIEFLKGTGLYFGDSLTDFASRVASNLYNDCREILITMAVEELTKSDDWRSTEIYCHAAFHGNNHSHDPSCIDNWHCSDLNDPPIKDEWD